MGVERTGGFWCSHCSRPVVAERTVDRSSIRGVLASVFGDGWSSPGPHHCSQCGGPVRPAVSADYGDWSEISPERVPVWRRHDRERLDADQD